jgi:ABC-2 type transport system permease protein
MQPQGEVYNLGYERYHGPREGRTRARRAIFENGVRTVLGLGRGPRAKILPALLFLGTIIPALIYVIVLSVAEPAADFLPGPADYYQVISIILLIFGALSAPELLCPDRRDNVIHLYLVRPLTPTDYLLGRFFAFFVIVLALAYSGQIILQVGLILSSSSPWQHIQDNWLDIPKFLGAGVLIALFITAIPMAVAAFTNRRAYAAVFVIGLFIISTGVADGLTQAEECQEVRNPDGSTRCDSGGEPVTGEAAKWFSLISIRDIPLRINDMIFNVQREAPSAKAAAELHDSIPITWYALFTLGPTLLLWMRYQRIRS